MMRRSTGVVIVWLCSAAAQSSDGHAKVLVYARDPAQTPQPTLEALPLAPQANGLRHPWLVAHSCVDAGAFGTLPTAQRVHVCSVVESASPDAQGNYVAGPAVADGPDPFAEQMLFYHGARTLQFFADLGLAPALTDKPLQLIANVGLPAPEGLLPFPDASFVRAHEAAGVLAAMGLQESPVIYFGQAHGVRIAYDSAAIRHEVSHAALARWLPQQAWFLDAQGTNTAPAAIAEALADYFAAVIADDPRLGAHAGHGSGQPLTRNLNTLLRCPAALSGTVHQDGLLLASALWAVRKQLGAELDRALVSALKTLRAPTALSVERLLQSTLDALGPKRAAAAAAFRERGLTPSCQRVLDLDPQQSFSSQTGKLVVPPGPLASSLLQLRASVPPNTKEVEIRMRAGGSEPALLAKNSPIRWTAAGAHDATLVTAATSRTAGELRFILPAFKGRSLYLQVVNRGQQPGWFDAVRVVFRH